MEKLATVLVVDDDVKLLNLIKTYLENNGFEVYTAENGIDALRVQDFYVFDIIVCDWMMPVMDGMEFVTKLREKNSVPVLMLTALSELDNKVMAYEGGIDDYMAKPFEPKELLLRIKSILKRSNSSKPNKKEVMFGNYIFNVSDLTLFKNKEQIILTDAEKTVLKILSSKYGEIVSREALADALNYGNELRGVDVVIVRLRKKIEDNPKKSLFLQTVRNKGYLLKG